MLRATACGVATLIALMATGRVAWGLDHRASGPVASDTLRLHGASGCVLADRLPAAIERLGGAQALERLPVTSVTASQDDSGTWTAALELRWPEGDEHRLTRASTCDELVERTALILAMAADQIRPAEPIRAPPTVSSSAPNTSVPVPATARRGSHALWLTGGGQVDTSIAAGTGAEFGYGYRRSSWRWIAAVSTWWVPTWLDDLSPAVRIDHTVVGGVLGVCRVSPQRNRWGVGACVAAEAGVADTRTKDTAVNKPALDPWVALRADIEVVARIAPTVALRASMPLVLPLLRHRYRMTGIGPVYAIAAFQVRLLLGVQLQFR